MSKRWTAALLLFGIAFAAPASAADKETRQMMADIRMLQEQSQQLQILIASLNEALKDALKNVNSRLDQQTETTRKAFADQKATIDTLASDLRVVRDRVDDTSVRVGSVSHEVEALRQSVELLNAPPAGAAPVDHVDPAAAASPDAPPPPAPAAPPRQAAVGMSPQRLWDEALATYFAGDYDLSVLGFESFIKSFPTDNRVDDAQLQIGNSYLQAGKYEQSVQAYDVVIRTYPTSNVVPDAYYKKGIAYRDLRQFERALEAFETVVKKYPDSDAATLAKQQLQDVTRRIQDAKKP